jgi:hypothetical protein
VTTGESPLLNVFAISFALENTHALSLCHDYVHIVARYPTNPNFTLSDKGVGHAYFFCSLD